MTTLDHVCQAFAAAIETRVGPDDDFFCLGGDSLASMVVVKDLAERLGRALPADAVFSYPTAARLAEAIEHGLVVEAACEMPSAGSLASPLQEAHLLLAPLISSRGYLSWVLQLNGPLDRAALAAAVDDVVRRHEVLRTRFERRDGALCHVVTPFTPGVLEEVDLSDHSKLVGLELAVEHVNTTFHALSPAVDPGLRATLYTISAKTGLLAIFVAEAVVDSESGPLLAAAISRAYAVATGQHVPPGLPDVSPASYVAHVAAHPVPDGVARRAREHWDRVGAGHVPRHLTGGEGGAAGWSFEATEWAKLVRLARRLRTTPYVVVLTAYLLALGERRLVVDSVVSDRSGVGTERMIGNFQSVVRIEGRVEPGDTFAAAVARTATAVRDAIAHAAVPAFTSGEPALGVSFYMFDSRITPVFAGVRRRRFRPRVRGREPLRLNCVAGPDGRQDLVLTSACAPQAVVNEVIEAIRRVLNTVREDGPDHPVLRVVPLEQPVAAQLSP